MLLGVMACYCVTVVNVRMQENIAASQMSLAASRANLSLPLAANVTGSASGSPDNELLMASVPPAKNALTPLQEQSTPTEPAAPTVIPRPRVVEDVSPPPSANKPVPTKSAEEDLESKLTPAPVSDADLIQPVKPYINKRNPDFKLANIMKGSIETNEAKDARKSADLDAKEAPEPNKTPLVVSTSTLSVILICTLV